MKFEHEILRPPADRGVAASAVIDDRDPESTAAVGHRSSSVADRLSAPLIVGNTVKQPGADGDPMINTEPSWS